MTHSVISVDLRALAGMLASVPEVRSALESALELCGSEDASGQNADRLIGLAADAISQILKGRNGS